MSKYRVTGKAYVADAQTNEGSLQNINCYAYGDSPENACDGLVNGRFERETGKRMMFVAVKSDAPSHYDCPITGGFLSFIEDDS